MYGACCMMGVFGRVLVFICLCVCLYVCSCERVCSPCIRDKFIYKEMGTYNNMYVYQCGS